ncbi:MAG: MBL fold metallo-hydrolase [Chitinophagaceae bacterium]|nr:MBL fold metallo-hydrolase [Chitinophagaceae bacterium]
MAQGIKFVKKDTAKLYKESNTNKVVLELLWGDRVQLLSATPVNGRYKVNARWAKNAFINVSDVGEEALLEVYFIDVGQGDGVLIVTPDRKHLLIDGGYTREMQPHGKSAADFVDWKFHDEYGSDTIELDAMISSHCDADHYGGLWDLLDETKKEELDCKKITVKKFYHAGVSWWTDGTKRFLGNKKNGALIDLLTGKTSLTNGLKPSAPLRLQGQWAQFLGWVLKSKASIERLAYNPQKDFNYLDGFEQDKEVAIKVLAPIEKTEGGKPTLKDLGSDSQNTNGNSLLLRVDYKKTRILLTGDLNQKSQQHIIQSFQGRTQELAADVTKACHHGSDDCSLEFLQHVQAAATIISSGDDETHAHPRPAIVAASGVTGFRKVENDQLVTPLVYSTEISRSVRMGDPYKINSKGFVTPAGALDIEITEEKKVEISYKHTSSGALNPKNKMKTMEKLKVVDGIVYGLVNVRTDGNKILCATMNEGKSDWDYRVFYSRF